MTKEKIEQLATEIKDYLDRRCFNGDVRIYFNGKCWQHGVEDEPVWNDRVKEFRAPKKGNGWTLIENANPKDYFEYADGIISMSFEGSFYDVMNSRWDYPAAADAFDSLIQRYGCWYDLGNYWNLCIHNDL